MPTNPEVTETLTLSLEDLTFINATLCAASSFVEATEGKYTRNYQHLAHLLDLVQGAISRLQGDEQAEMT